MKALQCKDCKAEGVTAKRVMAAKTDGTLEPGPRCVTHHRARCRRNRERAHGRRLEKNFGITTEIYQAIYESQGGRCFGCRVATGKKKRLAVDHDHECTQGHPPELGCISCCRAILCGPCNQIIGRLGVDALRRLIQVLVDPPAQKVIMGM